jgi:small conductance mechanosensitive channel
METIENGTVELVAAAETALRQASALAVEYSFSVFGAIIILVAGFIVAGVAERWALSGLNRIRGFDETLSRFFSKVLRYAILALVLVTVLAQFGVQTASIIAALGAIGLAIGLALQGTLQNIAAGIMLLVLRPFRVGEYVSTGSVAGTVREIGLFATEFKTYDGLFVLAPNSTLWNTPVTNYSRNPERMTEIAIGIGYDDDVEAAFAIYRRLADEDARILPDPAPVLFVSELADSAVVVAIRYWTRGADWFQTKLDFLKAAKKAFDAEGITIPFPQRDVHLYAEGPAAQVLTSSRGQKPEHSSTGLNE